MVIFTDWNVEYNNIIHFKKVNIELLNLKEDQLQR